MIVKWILVFFFKWDSGIFFFNCLISMFKIILWENKGIMDFGLFFVWIFFKCNCIDNGCVLFNILVFVNFFVKIVSFLVICLFFF